VLSVPSSWPFQEAKNIELKNVAAGSPAVFETGFGPSGRPHIGTFAEVARTIMVQNAFAELNPGRAASLYVFCDDMDGLRKVPGNIPNPELVRENLGKPLSRIPDPFGDDESYSAHMERELVAFLTRFGFKFELKSSAVEYASGAFNDAMRRVLMNYEKIRSVILPTLQEENRDTWSPLIPICEKCGKLYTTIVAGVDPERATVQYEDTGVFGEGKNRVEGCGHKGEVSALDGHAKVGWKVDWALRWFTYNVRYEMYGKDLIDSARLSAKICRILGGDPPAGMVYELFLDEGGKKISKSVGEGLTVDSWMKYAPIESLMFYLFQNPKKQRRLFFDAIPKNVDEYLNELRRFPELDASAQYDSVVWHLHKIGREAPPYASRINFSLALNLISGIGAGDHDLLLDYLRRYDPAIEQNQQVVEKLVGRAIAYFKDFVEPTKMYRGPSEAERAMFQALLARLKAYAGDEEDDYQSMVFDVAKEQGADPKALFQAVYQVILGQERGPRFGTFVKLVGKDRAGEMIRKALNS
jgi:lysyl-tRNA synthetase class 1